jgi:hypothetical protein
MPDDYVNLHVRIQRSKRNKLNIYIPWGTRDKMFRALVDMGNGPEFISLIITKHVKLTCKGLEVAEDGKKGLDTPYTAEREDS